MAALVDSPLLVYRFDPRFRDKRGGDGDPARAATVLYPTDAVVRTALRGAALYQLSWFDSHLWAYAKTLPRACDLPAGGLIIPSSLRDDLARQSITARAGRLDACHAHR